MTDDGIGPPLVDPALDPAVQAVAEARRPHGRADDAGRRQRSRRVRDRAGRDAAAADAQRPGLVARARAARAGGARDPRAGRQDPGLRALAAERAQAAAADDPRDPRRPDLGLDRSPNHDTKMWASRRLPRGPAEHPRLLQPRPATGSRRCSATGAASTPPTATPCSTTWSRRGLADPKRLGCYGNSYGGFMVNWLVGTSDRFAAAVSRNGVTNQVSAFANCDFGAMYNESEGLGDAADARGHRQPVAAVAAAPRREHPHAAADPAGRGRPALPAGRQRAAVRRAARLRPRGRVRAVPESTTRWRSSARPDRRVDRMPSGSWPGSREAPRAATSGGRDPRCSTASRVRRRPRALARAGGPRQRGAQPLQVRVGDGVRATAG